MAKDALGNLEEKVRQAADRLAELRAQNVALAEKVAVLEERLATVSERGEDSWEGEREEVRERVEALVATLERLLDE